MKKNFKKWLFSGSMLAVVLFLSGCMRLDENNNPDGFFSELMYDYIVVPMEFVLDWLGSVFGSYGLAIIAITILIRLILLPVTLNQQRSMMKSQMQMSGIQPIMNEIQEEMKATDDPERKQELNEELMMVYQDNGINPLSSLAGCLPLFIQMPIFIAIFHVFRHSEAIAAAEFLGIPLGSPSIILAIITGGMYYFESKLMQQRMPSDQPGGGTMTLMMPIMMLFMGITSPAGLTLYFLASAIVGIGQSYYMNNVFKPKIEAEMKEKYGDQKVATRRKPSRPKTDTQNTSANKASGQKIINGNVNRNSNNKSNRKRRNAGKQNRRK